MVLPVDYNIPIKDRKGKYHLFRPILVSVSGGKNIAYVTESGIEIKREPQHRYKNRVNRRKSSICPNCGMRHTLNRKYEQRTPIFIDDLNETELNELNLLEQSGEIKRFDDDVYYFPKTTMIGGVEYELPIKTETIIERRYFTDGNEVYGYISGHTLRNYAGLTRQVPSFLEVTTNKETEPVRDSFVGSKRVVTHRPPTAVNKNNAHILQFLDLMILSEPDHIDEISMYLFREWLRENPIIYDDLLPYITFFPEIVSINLEKRIIRDELTQRY